MERNTIIKGFQLAAVRAGVAFTFLAEAMRIRKNPVRAISLIRSLIGERKLIHENSGGIKAVRAGRRYYWSVNVPGWPSEAFRRFVRNEFLRIETPGSGSLQTVILGISSKCPLNCEHCYEWENISGAEFLTYDDLHCIMQKIKQKGIRHIQFSGGEPLARFDDMISLMKDFGSGTDFWINTSGYGLTREKAEIMKENGMTGAIISLDHWDHKCHNAFRNNENSFKWALEGARNCISSGIVVSLSLCPVREFVTKENLLRYIDLAREVGAGFIRILEPRPEGRYRGREVSLSAEQVRTIDDLMISLNNKKKYRDYPIIQFPGHHQRKTGCMGAGNRYLYIDPKGSFHACPFCRNSLGSAVTETIDAGIMKARNEGCHVFRTRQIS